MMRDRSQTPLDDFSRADLRPDDRISPNFKAYELTRSEVADRHGIDNRFGSDAYLRAAIHLARRVLQPVRANFGPLTPNSVYRSQALERVLKRKPDGWLSSSQHTLGCACDIEIVGLPTLELARWAADNLEAFDQIICECYDAGKGVNSGWVHISLKGPDMGANRAQTLSYVRDPQSQRMVYLSGLQGEVAARHSPG